MLFSLNVILPTLTPLKQIKQNICNSISFFLTIIGLKLIPRKRLDLAKLLKA